MKSYLLTRERDGKLTLSSAALIIDRDKKGRSIGSHVETQATSHDSQPQVAAALASHYYGADPGAQAQAAKSAPLIHDGFLIHAKMPQPGSRLLISSDVLDRFFALANQPAVQ